MDYEQLQTFYSDLASLVDAGKQHEAQRLVEKRFNELPEALQGEILGRFYFASLKEHVAQEETINHIQKNGVNMLELLESLKKAIEEKEFGSKLDK